MKQEIADPAYPTRSSRYKLWLDFSILVSAHLLLLPIWILLWILIPFFIWIGDRGPVFFVQQRVGKNGKVFTIRKFRTMIPDAAKQGPVWTAEDDPRITRFGKVLRRTALDELPELLSILKRDMSFVGPRPERPQFVDELKEVIPFYDARHRVKPGLMGWAQLKYPYGASVEDAQNKLKYDLYYVKNHSFFMDVLIVIQTVEVVLLGKGVH